jgi:hypothetical protein
MKYGFIYLWFDRKNKKYYIGCRWGTETDGYICSSSWMKQAYKHRPLDFKRRILKTKILDKKILLEEEYKFLKLIKKEELGKKYYNIHNHHFAHWSSNDNVKTIGQKISESHKNHPDWGYWDRGKIISEKTKEKNKNATNRQFENKENRKKVSEQMKKLWKDPIYRENMINKYKGKKISEETRQKMSNSQTKRQSKV